MKRRSSSPDLKKKTVSRARSERLIARAPSVYLGPDALSALSGDKGLLLGRKRPDWVDVLVFERRTEAKVNGLLGLRFDFKREDCDVVGIVISHKELDQHNNRLVRELVPGDVVIIPEKEKPSKGRAYVHLGGELKSVRLKLSRATSTRFHPPR